MHKTRKVEVTENSSEYRNVIYTNNIGATQAENNDKKLKQKGFWYKLYDENATTGGNITERITTISELLAKDVMS